MAQDAHDRTTTSRITNPGTASVEGQQELSQNVNATAKHSLNTVEQQDFELLNKFGVVRHNENGHVQYKLAGSTGDSTLFEAEATSGEFVQSEHRLETMTQSKIQDLKTHYHVDFSVEGENAVRPYISETKRGAMLHARAPRYSELLGVEAALKASDPSQFTDDKNKEALKFYFLKTPTYGAKTYDAGLFASDEKQKLAVFFEPDAQPDRPITATDALNSHQDIKTSIEALAAHEIAHNSEYQMGLWSLDKLKPIAKEIGWTTTDDNSYWLMRGARGEFYRLTNDGLSSDKGWVRCDSKGTATDDAGASYTDADKAPHLTNSEVRERALLRPPTDYFTSPDEMLADSLMLYRVGEGGRQELSKSGVNLYNAVKDFDQAEIDSRFGKTADGRSNKVRLPDGSVVDNDDRAQQVVANFTNTLLLS